MSEKDVSNEELLEDIRLTKLELNGYSDLVNGYAMLSKLPENIESGKSKLYRADCEYFSQLHSECIEFLVKLEKIKKDRGLE
jgi:hypothetical protein